MRRRSASPSTRAARASRTAASDRSRAATAPSRSWSTCWAATCSRLTASRIPAATAIGTPWATWLTGSGAAAEPDERDPTAAHGDLGGERGEEVGDQSEPSARQVHHRDLAPRRARLAGELVVGGEEAHPVVPAVGVAVLEPDLLRGPHRLAPRADRRARVGSLAVELRVHLAQEPEGVLVVAEPEVEPVLLDAAVHAPAARPLAAEPPAPLVHGDRTRAPPPSRAR